MALIAYFKDEDGNELPFSGSVWCWFGAWVDGQPGTCSQVEVREGARRYMLTAASFPGRSVTVKLWAPRGSEYRRLVAGPVHAVDMPCEWVGREAPGKREEVASC